MFFYQELPYKINAYCHNRCGFMPHLHQTIELMLIEKGNVTINIDDKEYVLTDNSLSIAFPYQIHSYIDNSEDIVAYVLFCQPSELKDLNLYFKNKLPQSPVINNTPDIIKELIIRVIESNNSDNILKNEIAKGYALALFGNLFPLLKWTESNRASLNTTQQLLEYCEENYKSRLTLDVLSKKLSINKYYISHIFNDKLKISFSSYITNLRISEAKYLLTNSELSITEIAYNSGFVTIRSFNRKFKEELGITPVDYRKNT